MKTNKVIIFTAPSGSGKTTILKEVMQQYPQLAFSISATTRAQRPGEAHAKDYYFISVEQFTQHRQQEAFVEWEEVYTDNFYGTLKSEIERLWKDDKIVVFDVDVKGAVALKRYFGQQAFAIFIGVPSIDTLKERLILRETETPQTLQKRLDKAEYETSFSDQFDYTLINDNKEKAIKEANNIIGTFITAP